MTMQPKLSPKWNLEELGGDQTILPVSAQRVVVGQSSYNHNTFISLARAYQVQERIEQAKKQNELEKSADVTKAAAINSIHQFMDVSYPGLYRNGVFQGYGHLKKDAPVLSTTTGFFNAVFGQVVWNQVNQEVNMFALLPKIPWGHTGWKVITTAGATSGGGVAENGAIPATTKPTLADLSAKPKTIATTFNVSAVEQALGEAGGDDMFDNPFNWMRDYSGIEHVKLLNRMLLTDVGTLASNNMESIDRVISSNAEVSNVGIDAGDSDIYSQDRDGGTGWTDAHVNHNSGVDRDLTLTQIDNLFENTNPFRMAGDQYIMVTGYDTLERIQQERSPQIQYTNPHLIGVNISMNGVSTVGPGVDGGFQVTSYKGVPVFPSNDVPKDTISRIYLINLNHMKIKVVMPTQFYSTGIFSNGNPFPNDKINDEGMFLTMAELIATKFNVHAKLRDLK